MALLLDSHGGLISKEMNSSLPWSERANIMEGKFEVIG